MLRRRREEEEGRAMALPLAKALFMVSCWRSVKKGME